MMHQEDIDGLDKMYHRKKEQWKKVDTESPRVRVCMIEVSKFEIKDKQTLKRKKNCLIIKQS